jgi:hypothetical protein
MGPRASLGTVKKEVSALVANDNQVTEPDDLRLSQIQVS